ncbi:hypothetical protein E2C01_099176 [Portunus trituberculatus]|uniref:Uncharacterized protein n=1 Tax=Portunus trituberculatus TaxID=210409 RepID=A0A5B7KG56_PORTR|nr:hypothetical protein [Portunus trituberculatus]
MFEPEENRGQKCNPNDEYKLKRCIHSGPRERLRLVQCVSVSLRIGESGGPSRTRHTARPWSTKAERRYKCVEV